MSCFSNGKLLICGGCNRRFTLTEQSFPEDLFNLLLEHDLPQIQWYCFACYQTKSTLCVNERLSTLEIDVDLLKRRLSGNYREIDGHKRYKNDYDTNDEFDASILPYAADISPLKSGSASPKSEKSIATAFKEHNKILNEIMQQEIRIDEKQAAKSVALVDTFMNRLLPHLKVEDVAFKEMFHALYKTGSSYNGLKISSPNEYDINLMLIPKDPFKLEVEFFDETKTFAKLKWSLFNPDATLLGNKKCVLDFLKARSDKDGYLDPSKVKAWFHGLMDVFCKTVPKLEGIKQVTLSESGPARTIVIIPKDGPEIHLDLVPIFEFTFKIFQPYAIPVLSEYTLDISKQFCSFIPKSCVGEERLYASDCKLSWKLYIPELDKKVLYGMECAKSVIKLLKLLRDRQNWKSIASYHMVTIVMWGIKNTNNDAKEWRSPSLYKRFLQALERLQNCLADMKLPYFLDPDSNLFHKLGEDECYNLSNRIKVFIKKLNTDQNNIYEIFSHKF